MASLIRGTDGYRIEWIARDNGTVRRPKLRLGTLALNRQAAQTVKAHVENLLAARASGTLPPTATAEWLNAVDDGLHALLVKAGIAKPRVRRTLGAWLTHFMERKADLKAESRRKLEQTKAKLIGHFTEGRGLADIAAEDASAWRKALADSGLSVAAVKTHIGNAKSIFAEAERLGLVAESPFAHLSGGVTPTSNTRYVNPEEIAAVIAEAPDVEWRLLFGLARYAGLRTPSETHLLTWADVDWDRARLRVRSPKTERFAGHAERLVPIDARLMALLEARYAAAAEGEVNLIGIPSPSGQRRRVERIARAAKVEPWADCWQTLRRSCEIEWAQTFPQYAVSRWIGHSITVSGRHYANAVPDELFDRAAKAKPLAHFPAQSGAKQTGTDAHGSPEPVGADAKKACDFAGVPTDAPECASAGNGAGGNRTPVQTPGIQAKHAISPGSLAHIPAHSAAHSPESGSDDPDLARLLAAWPRLTPEGRRAVLAALATAEAAEGRAEGEGAR